MRLERALRPSAASRFICTTALSKKASAFSIFPLAKCASPRLILRFTLSGGFQTDSFGGTGGYVAGIASLVGRTGALSMSAGLGAFGIYRYMDHGPSAEHARRVFVPALLPVLSIENARAGVGANLIVAPNFTYRGRDRSGFVLFQLSYRFN